MKTLYIPVTYGPYPYSAAKKALRMRPEAAQEVTDEQKAKGPYFESEFDAIKWAEQHAERLNKAHGSLPSKTKLDAEIRHRPIIAISK